MKKCKTRPYYLLLFILLLVTSCNEKTVNSNTVKILINGGNGEVKLSILDVLSLEDSILAETTIDTTGTGFLTVELSQPVLSFLKIGKKHTRVYLAPGYDLQVSLNSSKSEINYNGIGAEPNNYLEKIFRMQQDFEHAGGEGIFGLKPESFTNQVDSLENVFEIFHSHYADSVLMPKDVADLLKKKDEFYLISLRHQYGTMLFGDKINDTDADHSFKNLITNLPLDSTYLKIKLYEYALLLQMYMDQNFYAPFVTDKFPESSGYPEDYFFKNAHKTIKSNNYPSEMEEFFIAKNIWYSMNNSGLTPGIESFYYDFKNNYASSEHLVALNKKYNAHRVIAKGSPAPEITGTTLEGKEFKLSSLKGKAVYIDVWATWCGPCIKEFPYSKELQKKFNGNDNVVFLYVSVDKNMAAWKKKLSSEQDFEGIHIIDQNSSILDNYHIQGIPRYLLIDKDGKIAQANARRPSSNEIHLDILSVLNE